MPELPDSIWDIVPYSPGLWRQINAAPQQFERRVNGILKLTEFTCLAGDDPPWLIVAEAAAPAAGDFVIALLDFGWDDVLRGFMRPAGIASRSIFRKGRNKKKGFGIEIPEIGELIGEHLPGAKIVKSSRAMEALRFLWWIDGVVQRGLWYWMMLDLTTEFFYDFATNIMTSKRCAHGEHGSVIITDDLLGITGNSTTIVPFFPRPQAHVEAQGEVPIAGSCAFSPYGTLQAVMSFYVEKVVGSSDWSWQAGMSSCTSGVQYDATSNYTGLRAEQNHAILLAHPNKNEGVRGWVSISGWGTYYLRNFIAVATH